ncbi:glycoside hydrolase family 47 protein [Gymnopilus junonius]|uniref:alpha-1,2-Mannosidase n=1 Tax=Gymnopilus junonius TaxID=109634 RepID=A0A9P5NLI1_GYMJU|nr:glycoside hydrolase family 47 protein [Gymnopilus junonius]
MIWAPPDLQFYPHPPPPHVRPLRLPPKPTAEEQDIWEPRKLEVREAFKHAWEGYKTRAFPHDELLAVSGGHSDKFNGWGVTLFDSLDTMWIMGLRGEFDDAIRSIKDLHFNATTPNHYAPFFETTIRYLGGLLSAYALSGEGTLLRLADEMGQILVPAFRYTESGLPTFSVHVETGKVQLGNYMQTTLFAEAATCQLEFKYLAKLTGRKEYYERVQRAMEVFYNANVTDGLFADRWDVKTGAPFGAHYTIGAMADSAYEYLLKQWLLTGDEQAREQYLVSAEGIINNLIYITPNRGLMYAGEIDRGMMLHRLEHLSCFLPGMFALGAVTLDLPPETRELHEWVAQGLTYTCTVSYLEQKSGLGPETMTMPNNGKKWIEEVQRWKEEGRVGTPPGLSEPPPERDADKRDYTNAWPGNYYLRPETVESIFYMWRTTGDVKWREWGNAIFEAINRNSRTEYGFASVKGIDKNVGKIDDMPSYFLAETFKYLYLLFDDPHSITFNHWVFNTEAHPIPIFSWNEMEKKAFNITS